jgi:hypothetical protein
MIFTSSKFYPVVRGLFLFLKKVHPVFGFEHTALISVNKLYMWVYVNIRTSIHKHLVSHRHTDHGTLCINSLYPPPRPSWRPGAIRKAIGQNPVRM